MPKVLGNKKQGFIWALFFIFGLKSNNMKNIFTRSEVLNEPITLSKVLNKWRTLTMRQK